ncbi:putative non-specific serine/threonine protein kinase [Dioscorea sansibarensis]
MFYHLLITFVDKLLFGMVVVSDMFSSYMLLFLIYIFSVVGHFIRNQSLEDQCCGIISTLLDTCRINPTKEAFNVLGEQLQFLVSKLVACCIPSEAQATYVCSPKVISLLHQLVVVADLSLYDYIRELELFPVLDSFIRIQTFHEQLCEAYSLRDHFCMPKLLRNLFSSHHSFFQFIRRCSYLPRGLLLWSLQNLHKKLQMGEIIQLESNDILRLQNCSRWNADPEVVSAVCSLVRLVAQMVGIGDPYDVIFHLPRDPR